MKKHSYMPPTSIQTYLENLGSQSSEPRISSIHYTDAAFRKSTYVIDPYSDEDVPDPTDLLDL